MPFFPLVDVHANLIILPLTNFFCRTNINSWIYSYHHIIEHTEVADELITSKNTDLTRFFIIKPTDTQVH